jgi:BirA family transcriptional regulator, biotin operon repressor / biotin---[acetyl-CoA-carboxylase] ligase
MEPFDSEYFLKLAPQLRGKFEYFPFTGSTNFVAKQRLQSDGAEFVLLADKQTAGRGRLNRQWEAPFGSGILCSLTLPLAPLGLEQAYLYTAALALAVQKAVKVELGIGLNLKWPNDVLRDGRKCCGILAEIESGWLVLGFGLNTGLTERDLQEAGLAARAANVAPPDCEVGREKLLAEILGQFAAYRQLLETNPDAVRQEWADQLITVGQPVNVLDMHGNLKISGIATGVDPSGGLQVREATGQLHLVQAGDVSVRLNDGKYA